MPAPPPHLVLRVDADRRIGTGYLMRCVALAEAWGASGGGLTFVGAYGDPRLGDRVRATGGRLVPLTPGGARTVDLRTTLETLEITPHACCALDGPHHDADYQAAIRAAGHPLLVIDDVGRLPHYDADLLLNQNIDASGRHYATAADTVLLRGPRFALLRSGFRSGRDRLRETPRLAEKVLVTMGGADADNVSPAVLRALAEVGGVTLRVRVVAGPANPHVDRLRRAAGPGQEVLVDVTDMAALMTWADVAVSGAGSTALELAGMGVPTILLVTAEDQPGAAAAWHQSGAAVSLGWYRRLRPHDLSRAVEALVLDRSRRVEMSRRGRDMVDGFGAARVVDALWPGGVSSDRHG